MNIWWNYPISKAVRFMEHTRWRLYGCVVRLGPIAVCVIWRRSSVLPPDLEAIKTAEEAGGGA